MMSKDTDLLNKRYQLRYAAGNYWLLDTFQNSIAFRAPLCMNELGAEIWGMYSKKMSLDEMCEQIQKEYKVKFEDAKKDIQEFLMVIEPYVFGTM